MLVLASTSPRRKELLANAGIVFECVPAGVPEVHQMGESFLDYARRLAREKAEAAALRHPDRWVLGADTIVVCGGELLEKPADAADAARILRKLSGRAHQVTTAVCLLGKNSGKEDLREETTSVHFLPLTEEEIAAYIATGEPMDKAGAYAIQGIAGRWVHRIEGDYFNVMGLPVSLVWRMLREAGELP